MGISIVHASIGSTPYTVELSDDLGHRWLGDEPEDVGGANAGPSPERLLLSALGTCTAVTVSMYAARKQWPLTGVKVELAFNPDGKPAAGFPISIGNEKNDPLPLGEMAIKNAVDMPSFTYNPALLKTAPKDAEKVEIAPGPNNPVGTIWLGLTKPHWGIHGTPEPAKVGHSETNGCIHLTNWDAERLAKIVKVGAKVDVKA